MIPPGYYNPGGLFSCDASVTYGVIKHNHQKEPDPNARGTEENKMTKINENKLNMVAGGDMLQTADDSTVLYHAGLLDEEYGAGGLMIHWVEYSGKVDAAFAKAGIRSVTKPFGSNQYYRDGKEITQDLAWYIVRHLNK